MAGREPAASLVGGQVVDANGTVRPQHLAEKSPPLGQPPDPLHGDGVDAVVDEACDGPGCVTDGQRGVAGVEHRGGPVDDALQDLVEVVGPRKLQRRVDEPPESPRPGTRRCWRPAIVHGHTTW